MKQWKVYISLKADSSRFYMWLEIEACGVTVSYNLTDIIPEQFKAEKPAE